MLHERADAGTLTVVRVVVFSVWLLLVVSTPLHNLAVLPQTMFEPGGVLTLLPDTFWDTFIAPIPLTLFRIILAATLALVIAGVRPLRPLAILAAVGLLLFDGTLKAYGGYFNHSRFGLLYIATLLSLTIPSPMRRRKVAEIEQSRAGGWTPDAGAMESEGWPQDQAVVEPQGSSGMPKASTTKRYAADPASILRLGALVLALAYMVIGIHRLLIGGLEIFLNDALATYTILRTFEPSWIAFEAGYAAIASVPLLTVMKVGFFVTTLAEIVSPFAVFHRRLRLVWLAIIVPFHITTLFTMNIFFWENLILIALLYTELPTRIADQLRQRRPQPVPAP